MGCVWESYLNVSREKREVFRDLTPDLDSLAGAVAYRHCLPEIGQSDNPAQTFHDATARAGLYLATASADRLDMFGRLDRAHIRDLRFSGFVSWTGNSSMEVIVKMEGSCDKAVDEDGYETLLLGRFAMVCRDTQSQKARKVPKLILESDEERTLWNFGDCEFSTFRSDKICAECQLTVLTCERPRSGHWTKSQ